MSWYAAPSILRALSQATALWPDRSKASDGTIGDASHSASTSDHNPDSKGCVHAFDLTHDPAHGVDTFKLADDLRNRCLADPSFQRIIKYIISNRRIYNPSISPAWRYYSGSSPHTDHVHVSINYTPEAENWNGQWWTKGDWLDMATEDDVRKVVREELEKVIGKLYVPGGTVLKALYAKRTKPDGTEVYNEEIHDVWGDTQAIRKHLGV